MGSKNGMLKESTQTSKFGKQPISTCELLPPPFMTFWVSMRKLCDENTNPITRHVPAYEVIGLEFLSAQTISAMMQRLLLFSLFSLARPHFLQRPWHVLVVRLIEWIVKLVVENKVTRSGVSRGGHWLNNFPAAHWIFSCVSSSMEIR